MKETKQYKICMHPKTELVYGPSWKKALNYVWEPPAQVHFTHPPPTHNCCWRLSEPVAWAGVFRSSLACFCSSFLLTLFLKDRVALHSKGWPHWGQSSQSLTPHRYWFEKCHHAWHFGKFRTMNHCSLCSRLAENRHQCHKFSRSPGNKLRVAKWSTQSHIARTEPRFNTKSVWYTKTWLCTQCHIVCHRHFLPSYRQSWVLNT